LRNQPGGWIASIVSVQERESYRWEVRFFTVLLAIDAVESLARCLHDGHANPAVELGGILFGNILDDNRVEITDFELLTSSHRRGIPYDLSPTERNRIQRYVRGFGRRSGVRPLGYFRTHLRPGLFLDQSDLALMAATFPAPTGIALAIRAGRRNGAEAGIFFWKDGEMDRRKPERMFPFDAEALRVQGPLEKGGLESSARHARSRFAQLVPRWKAVRAPLQWLAGVSAVVGLAFAVLSGFHEHRGQSGSDISAASALQNRLRSSAPPENRADSQTLDAPPAVFDDEPAIRVEPDGADAVSSAARSPFDTPGKGSVASSGRAHANHDMTRYREAPQGTVAPAASAQLPASAPSLAGTIPPAPLSAALSSLVPVPAPEPAVRTEPSTKSVSVDVSVEPKGSWALKRIARRVPSLASHVPLLGRLPALRHENGDNIVSARPDADLEPQVPASAGRTLDSEVAVDVAASIDSGGTVRNTEILRGAETEFAGPAADAVRSAAWKPARSGDRNVAMEVVVHYRFFPKQGQ
jgi:hypothetical protein